MFGFPILKNSVMQGHGVGIYIEFHVIFYLSTNLFSALLILIRDIRLISNVHFQPFFQAIYIPNIPMHQLLSSLITFYKFFAFQDFLQDLEHEMTSWKALNLCRSIAVILGWLVVSLRPNTDLLYKNLKRLSTYDLKPEFKAPA